MVYSNQDRAGWFCHETGQIKWIGSIADMINWVFGELLNNRPPENDMYGEH